MIDGDLLIERQLALSGAESCTFDDGSATELRSDRLVPMLNDAGQSLSLAGDWRVCKWPFAAAPAVLAASETDDAAWPLVAQPGKVFYSDPEELPSTVPNWNRVSLTHLDPQDGAVMRRTVVIPETWDGQRIYLRFDGIYPAGVVFCNGRELGTQLSGLTPVEWDVTDLVTPGATAVVAVRLLRRHAHVQLDMPRHACEFAGLSQVACFHAVAPCQIGDYHLDASLDKALAKGRLAGTVSLRNLGNTARRGKLTLELTDAAGHACGSVAQDVELAGGATASVGLALEVVKVTPWSDEAPVLYGATLTLALKGAPCQTVAWRTGFRRFEFVNGRPLLNGAPVKFRGVNHLTYHPDFGMHTPREWLVRNLTLMKRANVNCIRTHFLGPRELADVCDELGMFLCQELPIDWGTNYIHLPEWVGPILTRLDGGIRRDRHHPSVMVWCIGNENMPQDEAATADGWNHLRLYHRFAKRLDPSRPTMFPPPGPANKIDGIFELRVGDIADTHYSFNLVRQFRQSGVVTNPRNWKAEMETVTREQAIADGWSGAWFSSEYGIFNYLPDLLHSPYNSIITDTPEEPLSGKNTQEVFYQRLKREWGYMRDDPTCLGGAYFPWLCAGTGNNPWGWVRWGEDADWGIVTADLLPKPAFWVMRVLFSPIAFPARLTWHPGEKAIAFDLHNGFNRHDLADCTLRVMMNGGGRYMTMMREWRDVPIAGQPGETVRVTIPLNDGVAKTLEGGGFGLCRCILLDPDGNRTIEADILVLPPAMADQFAEDMPIGPDSSDGVH